MNIHHSPFRIVLAACVLAPLTVASFALAEKSKAAEWCESRVKWALLVPLANKEKSRSRFSREAPSPSTRTARALSSEALKDSKGRAFLPFVIEASYGEEAFEEYRGCAYQGSGNVYIAFGDEYRPADFLLGKRAEPVEGVCEVPLRPAG